MIMLVIFILNGSTASDPKTFYAATIQNIQFGMKCHRGKRPIRLRREGSFSEPDLTTAWKGRPGSHLRGYPPGFTVDELRWHRKKKPPGNSEQKDNLKREDGSMKKIKSEYQKKFKQFAFSSENLSEIQELAERRQQIRPFDYLKLEGDFEYNPEYKELFIEHSSDGKEIHKRRAEQLKLDIDKSSNLHHEDSFMVNSSEMQSQFVRHANAKRAEITRSSTNLYLEGEVSKLTETADKYVEINLQDTKRPDLMKTPSNLKLEGNLDTLTEKTEKYIPFELKKRETFHKKPTNLHLEGEMSNKTEVQDKFVPHKVEKRPVFTKKETSLKLEGEMSVQTEKEAKYVPFELTKREKFQKRPTNLHLSGELDIQTEKREKYIPFEVQKRVPLAKSDTNLQLEGSLVMTPEYRDEFIQHQMERTQPKRPINNLGSNIDENVDVGKKKDNFFEEYKKPYRPFDPFHEKPSNKENIPHKMDKKRRELSITEEGSKLEEQTTIDGKNKAIGSLRSISKQVEDISGQESRQKKSKRQIQAGNLRTEGVMELSAEYKSSYVDFPRERSIVKRPEGSLKTSGHISHLSEKSSQYIPHGVVPRTVITRPEDNLKMSVEENYEVEDPEAIGSRFECQPEYRKAYNDYLQRENLLRKPRKLIKDVEAEKSKIPLLQFRRSSKSPGTASSTKSRSKSPPDLRRRVPRTPVQQRVLVPDMGQFTPRRPSSIFGPKTGRWYPRTVSPEINTPRGYSHPCGHFSDEDWDCPGSHRCSSCCEGCCKCLRRSISRWESPCRKDSFQASSSRYHSPSPRRRLWSHEQDYQSTHRPEEKPSSFVVLTDKVEINNNRLQGAPGGPPGPEGLSGGGGGGIRHCKEQKWMPPWYEPPI